MIARKLEEILSAIYRFFVFPFIRIYCELSTKSIMKQRTYINKGTSLGGRNYIGDNTVLSNVEFGYGSYISRSSILSNARVGKYCSIGPNLECLGGSHPTKGFVSMHPSFYAKTSPCGFSFVKDDLYDENKYTDKEKGYFYEIGNDVWIGANVSLAQGVHIGNGAVVGANSLVLNDIEPYSIYAGVPAKKIGTRFDEDKISKLQSIKWWDKGEDFIQSNIDSFSDISLFLENIK